MKLNKIFEPKGVLSKHFDDYEYRPEQLEMAEMVKRVVSGDKNAMIEGGTGVGKSFAYLVPAILSGEKTMVATSNKSLQDQLDKKDLPELFKMLGKEFTWAVVKGRANYFCEENFRNNSEEINKELSRVGVNDIVEWVKKDGIGDMEFYPEYLSPKIRELVTCETGLKHGEKAHKAICYADLAKEKAEGVDIVLVNHTLLALDVAIRMKSDGKAKILPEYDLLVIDEAHSFPGYASMAFSDEVNIWSIKHLVNATLVRTIMDRKTIAGIEAGFRKAVKEYLPEKKYGWYVQREEKVFKGMDGVVKGLEKVLVALDKRKNAADSGMALMATKLSNEADNLIRKLKNMGKDIPNMLRWSEAKDANDKAFEPTITLKSVPIDIADILHAGIFSQGKAVCISATLSTNGNFIFYADLLGVPNNAYHLIVGSPFDYEKNTLFYITPGEKEQSYELSKLLEASKGRALVLFTSYMAMKQMYDNVETEHPKLIQTQGVSRKMLLEEFLEKDNAVLFGTKSFWQGVDIRGAKLSMVVIHKIPFDNPSDLIYRSRTEKCDEEHGRGAHWERLTIPSACIQIKQGAGRLVRSKEDKGVFVLLDARVNFKNYKEAVIGSFPLAPRTQTLEKVFDFFKKIGD